MEHARATRWIPLQGDQRSGLECHYSNSANSSRRSISQQSSTVFKGASQSWRGSHRRNFNCSAGKSRKIERRKSASQRGRYRSTLRTFLQKRQTIVVSSSDEEDDHDTPVPPNSTFYLLVIKFRASSNRKSQFLAQVMSTERGI